MAKVTKKVALISFCVFAVMGSAVAALAYIGTIHYGKVTVYNAEPSDIRGSAPLASYNVTSSTLISNQALMRNGWTCNADWTRPPGIDIKCRHRDGARRQTHVDCPTGNTGTIISGSLGLYTDQSEMTIKGRCIEKHVHVVD